MPISTPRRRRWWPFVLGALLLLGVGLYAMLLSLVRPTVEKATADALGTPVSIGSLGLRLLGGEVVARDLSIGQEGEQVKAGALAVTLELASLLRGAVVVDRIELEQPSGTVRFDDQFQLVSPVLAMKEGGGGAGPAVAVREVVVTGGDFLIVYPLGRKPREVKLGVTRLDASEITAGEDGALSMRAVFEGTIHDAPLTADTTLRFGGAGRQIGGTLSLTGFVFSGDVLPLPEQFAGLTGELDVQATYETAKGSDTPVLKLDVKVREPKLSGEAETKMTAKVIALPQVRVDPAKSLVELGNVDIDTPLVDAAVTDDGLVLPIVAPNETAAPAPAEPELPWKFSIGRVRTKGGELRLHRGEASETLSLRSAELKRFTAGRRGPFSLAATQADGAAISAEGELGLQPMDAALTVSVRELALARWARLLPSLPLQLARGQGDADVRVTYVNDKLQLSGTVEARDLASAPPNPERAAEVLAVHVARADISLNPGTKPALNVPLLRLSYPYAMVQRHPTEIFPYSVFIGNEAAPAGTEPEPRETLVKLGHVEAEHGRLEFMDMTMTPPYWTLLADVALRADEVRLPQGTVEHFELTARHDELSPVEVSGSFTKQGLEGRAELHDVLLESMNAYVAPLLGYRVTSGRVTMTGVATPSPSSLQSVVEVVVRGIDVLQTGTDVIQQESGVPLPVALSLISSVGGQIDLELPISVDTQSGKLSIGSVVGQAVRRAIVGALTSPLRILGSLFGTKGAPHAFAIAPVPFAVGRGDLDAAGTARIAEIARIIEKNQGLFVVTLPQVSAADIAAVGTGGAALLATQRQTAVRDALGVEAARLIPSPWTRDVGDKATGKPSVYIELQDAR